MEPLDVAHEKFCTFLGEVLPTYWDTIKTEADTRFKIIDKLFVHVLGWPEAHIHLEEQAGEKRSDYRLTVGTLNRMIVEAKREGRNLGILEEHSGRAFKLNGGSFKTEAAQEGIGQVIHYCGYRACELGCITNGRQWMIFRGNRGADGIDTLEGKAVVFGSLEAVKNKFQKFYDLLSYEAVGEFRYLSLLDGESQVDNIVYVATTNYPERLDRRFVDRPSRFDTIVWIGMPSADARRAYLQAKEKVWDASGLDYLVDKSHEFSIAHMRELLILIKCLGYSAEAAVERLSNMKLRPPNSADAPNKRKVGFVG